MYQTSCPYCGKKFGKLTPSHLKMHNKTKWDAMNEFPQIPRHFFGACTGIKTKPPTDLGSIEYSNYTDRRIKKLRIREV